MPHRAFRNLLLATAAALAVAACAADALNLPINAGLASVADQGRWPQAAEVDDTIVGLAFSGGGTRAAAFSHGVLTALDRETIRTGAGPRPLTEAVDFVAGVSGGSVTAAYFGLKGRDGLADFRSRFLERNAEEGIDTTVSLGNVVKVLTAGGINADARLAGWFDQNLFEGATYADLFARKKPIVWIGATDLYNRVPFVFEPLTFNAICSDLSKVRLSEAVAASAAVPGVFVPINVENFGGTCGYHMPKFMERALSDRSAPAMLRASAQALARLRDHPERLRYVKLLDGGLTDNFGVHGLAIMRTNRDRAYIPMTAEQAARMRRMLFLVVDSGRGPGGAWTQSLASRRRARARRRRHRRRDRFRLLQGLRLFPRHDGRVGARRPRLALRSHERRGGPPARHDRRLELRRRRLPRRPRLLRRRRARAQGAPRPGADPLSPAARDRRDGDRRRRGGGAQQPDLPRVPAPERARRRGGSLRTREAVLRRPGRRRPARSAP